VPAELADAKWSGPVHQVAPGSVLIDIPGVGRAIVRDGDVAGVEFAEGMTEGDVRWLMDRPVAQAARLLQGQFALRAAGVVIAGRAVAITGRAGGGKSSVAAALAARGHAVLGDNEVIVAAAPGGGVTAVPSTSCLDLWDDIVGAIGLAEADGAIVRPALSKRRFAFTAGVASPLAIVVLLEESISTGVEEMHGAKAVVQILEHTVLAALIDGAGLRSQHFAWGVRVAGAARVVKLSLDRYRRDPAADAASVEALLR
jgi:hypothetical protein